MENMAAILTPLISLGTFILEIAAIGLLVAFFWYRRGNENAATFLRPVAGYALHGIFLFSTLGIIVTLWYSEVLGFIPCGLCWTERIFLYPQAFIAGVALWRRDRDRIFDYILILSIAGAVVALYHHYLQMGGTSVLPCPASGNADCAKRLIFEYGHITFPWIAFVTFASNALLALIAQKFRTA